MIQDLPFEKSMVWEGSCRPSGARVQNEASPDLILWCDRGTGLMRGFGVTRDRQDRVAAVWASLQDAMVNAIPGSSPCRPGTVVLDKPELVKGLQGLAQPFGIQVRLEKKLPELDQVFLSAQEMLQDGPGFSYLDVTDVQPEDVRALSEETIRFFDSKPFADIPAEVLLRLDGLGPEPIYSSILGNSGIEFGLSLYFTRAAAQAYLSGLDPADTALYPVLGLTAMRPDEMPIGLQAEIEVHEWPSHPLGFPALLRNDRETMQPTAEEIQLMTRAMAAVALFAQRKCAGSYAGVDVCFESRVSPEPNLLHLRSVFQDPSSLNFEEAPKRKKARRR